MQMWLNKISTTNLMKRPTSDDEKNHEKSSEILEKE